MLHLLLALFLCTTIHLLAIAAAGVGAGVGIRTVALGVGPRLFERGRFRLGAVPAGGHVRFVDSREGPLAPGEKPRAFDGKPLVVQLAIMLSGCAALGVMAFELAGPPALRAFVEAPVEFVRGAVSPFGSAQQLLADLATFLRSAPPLTVVGIVAAKLAAINLLPLPALNGGAVVAAVARALGLHRHWPPGATQALLLGLLALPCSWLVAIVVFVSRA